LWRFLYSENGLLQILYSNGGSWDLFLAHDAKGKVYLTPPHEGTERFFELEPRGYGVYLLKFKHAGEDTDQLLMIEGGRLSTMPRSVMDATKQRFLPALFHVVPGDGKPFYKSVSFFVNTMRNRKREDRLIRSEAKFYSLWQKLRRVESCSDLGDPHALAAEYGVGMLLARCSLSGDSEGSKRYGIQELTCSHWLVPPWLTCIHLAAPSC